jgi:hypothetical protein
MVIDDNTFSEILKFVCVGGRPHLTGHRLTFQQFEQIVGYLDLRNLDNVYWLNFVLRNRLSKDDSDKMLEQKDLKAYGEFLM